MPAAKARAPASAAASGAAAHRERRVDHQDRGERYVAPFEGDQLLLAPVVGDLEVLAAEVEGRVAAARGGDVELLQRHLDRVVDANRRQHQLGFVTRAIGGDRHHPEAAFGVLLPDVHGQPPGRPLERSHEAAVEVELDSRRLAAAHLGGELRRAEGGLAGERLDQADLEDRRGEGRGREPGGDRGEERERASQRWHHLPLPAGSAASASASDLPANRPAVSTSARSEERASMGGAE